MEFNKMFDYGESEKTRIIEGGNEYLREEVFGSDKMCETVYLRDDAGRITSEFFWVDGSEELIGNHRIIIDENTSIELKIGGMADELIVKKGDITVVRQNITRNREIMQHFVGRIKAGELK